MGAYQQARDISDSPSRLGRYPGRRNSKIGSTLRSDMQSFIITLIGGAFSRLPGRQYHWSMTLQMVDVNY